MALLAVAAEYWTVQTSVWAVVVSAVMERVVLLIRILEPNRRLLLFWMFEQLASSGVDAELAASADMVQDAKNAMFPLALATITGVCRILVPLMPPRRKE